MWKPSKPKKTSYRSHELRPEERCAPGTLDANHVIKIALLSHSPTCKHPQARVYVMRTSRLPAQRTDRTNWKQQNLHLASGRRVHHVGVDVKPSLPLSKVVDRFLAADVALHRAVGGQP